MKGNISFGKESTLLYTRKVFKSASIRLLLLLFVVSIFASITQSARAQSVSSTLLTTEKVATFSPVSTLESQPATESQEEIPALSARQQERVQNLAANITNRMEAVTNRLQKISNRVSSRSNKLSLEGFDTTEASSLIQDASGSLQRAIAALNSIDQRVYDMSTSIQPKTEWSNIRATYTETKLQIKRAYDALRGAVVLLKEPPRTNVPENTQ